MPLPTALFSLIGLAISPADGRVLLVDASGRGDFVDVQSAVQVADRDDLIYVVDHPEVGGRYDGFVVSGKGVTIVGRTGGLWSIGPSSIEQLPLGESVTLIGLGLGAPAARPEAELPEVFPSHTVNSTALTIEDCLGAVRIERCTVVERGLSTGPLVVRRSADVALIDSLVTGGRGLLGTAPAVLIDDSMVELLQTGVRGARGVGSPLSCFQACLGGQTSPGSDAIQVQGASFVKVEGSHVVGGGFGFAVCPACDTPPGHGIVVSSGQVFVRDSVVEGGPAWQAPNATAPIIGSVSTSGEVARSLDVARVVPANGRVAFEVGGEPGEFAWLLITNSPARRSLGLEVGALLGSEPIPSGRIGLGTLDTSGRWSGTVELPEADGAGVSRRIAQVVFSGPHGVRFGAAATLLSLGPDAPIAPPGARIHVDSAAPPGGNGRSWANAVDSLTTGLGRAAGSLDAPADVWVREGRFAPTTIVSAVDARFVVVAGTVLRGGFRGDEGALHERDVLGRHAVLDGDILGDDQPGFLQRTDNTRWLFAVAMQSLDYAYDGDPNPPADVASTPTVLDRITLRGAYDPGSEQYEHVVTLSGSVELIDCRILDNWSRAAALFQFDGALTCTRTTWRGNRCSSMVLRVAGSDPLALLGCEVIGNRAERSVSWRGLAHLNGTTIALNSNAPGQATIQATGNSGLQHTITNSIIYGNISGTSTGQSAQIGIAPASLVVATSCVGGWTGQLGGVGNTGADPRFVDDLGSDGTPVSGDEDVRLFSGSLCIDSGGSHLVPATLLTDLDGRPRRNDDPLTPDIGSGPPPIVDMGAYER